MKKIQYLVMLAFLTLFGLGNVYAACTTEENNQIRSEAVQVKGSYEVKTRVLDETEYGMPDGTPSDADIEMEVEYFEVIINNLTENLYVTVHNDVTGENNTYTYQDTDNGSIKFNLNDISEVVTLTITVYSSDNTSCANTQMYQTDLKLPRYNNYYSDGMCIDASDFYLCQKYTTIDSVDYEEFIDKVEAYKAGKIDNNGSENSDAKEEQSKEKEENNTVMIVGLTILIVIVGIGIVIIVKRQRRNKNEEI